MIENCPCGHGIRLKHEEEPMISKTKILTALHEIYEIDVWLRKALTKALRENDTVILNITIAPGSEKDTIEKPKVICHGVDAIPALRGGIRHEDGRTGNHGRIKSQGIRD